MVRGHQSENVLQSKISMTAPAGFVLGGKKRPSACSTWHVPSRPAPECFSAGSTWPPLKRPHSDGVMWLERTAVLTRYEEMKRRQQTGLQKMVDGSEPGIHAIE
jgi:hypothetical protein